MKRIWGGGDSLTLHHHLDEISIRFIYANSTFTGGSNEVGTEISQNYPWWTASTTSDFGGDELLETIDIPEFLLA